MVDYSTRQTMSFDPATPSAVLAGEKTNRKSGADVLVAGDDDHLVSWYAALLFVCIHLAFFVCEN